MRGDGRPVTWARLRREVVWAGLRSAFAEAGVRADLACPSRSARIVDAGGGTGGFAVPLAEEGFQVTVVDPSPDALASLARRGAESDVAGRVRGVQGDLAQLTSVVRPASADALLCHEVLEVLEAPEAALTAAAAALRPGGLLRVVAANRPAAVLGRVLTGRFADAERMLAAAPGEESPRLFERDQLVGLVESAGASVLAVHGVRVFTDLPHVTAADDADLDATEALLRMEIAVAERPPFLDLASRLHVIARRDGPSSRPRRAEAVTTATHRDRRP